MTTVWQKIEAFLSEAETEIGDFLSTLAKTEIQDLAPIVESALPTVVQDAGALATPAGWLSAVVEVGKAIIPQLEAKATTVAGASIVTAIGVGLNNYAAANGVAPSSIATGVPATPAPVVEPEAAAATN